MKIIRKLPNENGGYNVIQSWALPAPPDGYAVWPDELDTAVFYEYNGFVILTIEQVNGWDTVADYEPNVEAWEAWKASLPEETEPEYVPTTEERVTALEEEKELLKAQVAAQSDQMDFYEDCIAEMAAVVYA